MIKQQSLPKPEREFFAVNIEEPTSVQGLLSTNSPELLTPSFRKLFKKDLQVVLFVIKVNHGQKEWKQCLCKCRLYKTISDLIAFEVEIKKKYKQQIPAFPVRKENELKQFLPLVREFLEVFIKKIVNVTFYEEQFEDFFCFFPQRFGNGIIHAETQLKKHSGGRYTEATCSKKIQNICCCCRNWRTRWFTVTDEGVFYTVKRRDFQIKQMLNFSSNFKIYCGFEETGSDLGIEIKSSYRRLELKAADLIDFVIFVSALKKSYSLSPHKDLHRYSSFSDIKVHCSTEYFVDGENYFARVQQQILNAQKYIYITDWMMTPYFQLVRPRELSDRLSRLDYILEQAASKGVKVYIILYMEPKIALNNDSEYVENYFQNMHSNIKVVRHPNFILIPFLWSHHEKMVIVDQKVAFMGGLDICYGRWDTQEHKIIDQTDTEKQLWKGADYCNFRTSDIYSPRNFLVSNIDKKNQPRMPWHDVCVRIEGGSVHDLSRHFIQYWNFVNFQTKFDERELLLHSGTHSVAKMPRERQAFTPSKSFSRFFENIKESISPSRKPHETAASISNKKIIQARGSFLEESFRQRDSERSYETRQEKSEDLNTNAEEEGEREYYDHYLKERPLLPNIDLPNIDDLRQYSKKVSGKIKGMFTLDKKYAEKVSNDARLMVTHEEEINKIQNKGIYRHQILRSSSTWSLGLEQNAPESSIHEAYLDLIRNSQHFIYIENQFFISKENKVCSALIERINKAFILKEDFKVMLLMPLLPGFEGDVRKQSSSSIMRVQLYWEYRTLCRAKNSLYSSLSHIPNLDDYLKVYSLRQHDITSDGVPVTEILYIHSKLMIVDDLKVILGSANINDRSLLGDRDSEIAICIECEKHEVQIDEWGRQFSRSARDLRTNLYSQHFGFHPKQCQNFLDEVMWKQIRINAKNNTQIYRRVFGCYPDDEMKVISDVEKLMIVKPEKELYLEEKGHIKGHVVEFPLHFLENQNLNLKINQREFFIPYINFT